MQVADVLEVVTYLLSWSLVPVPAGQAKCRVRRERARERRPGKNSVALWELLRRRVIILFLDVFHYDEKKKVPSTNTFRRYRSVHILCVLYV